MVVGSPAHKKAVQSLWVGKATITVLDGVLNPANGRTEPQERILAADIPCRISHKSVVRGGAAGAFQGVGLIWQRLISTASMTA